KDLNIGVEFQYSLGSITPCAGTEFLIGVGNDANDLGINPFAGFTIDINEKFAADAHVYLGIGDRYGDDMPITISANFFLNF
ncbi:MAG: hypothetical protein FWH22_09345, partial [Fibromonadales bacterium]|nr:hypothetical protein [Fibromonadales bacterium]